MDIHTVSEVWALSTAEEREGMQATPTTTTPVRLSVQALSVLRALDSSSDAHVRASNGHVMLVHRPHGKALDYRGIQGRILAELLEARLVREASNEGGVVRYTITARGCARLA